MTNLDYLSLLFNEDEFVAVGESKYDTRLASITEIVPKALQFVGLNPMRQGASRNDESVVSFRNFLLELDFGTLEDQYEYMEALKVPLSTCVFSGSKSLHFIVALDQSLDGESEWRRMAELLLALVSKADPKNKNPSRFTRIGGGFRPDTGLNQEILELRSRISLEELESWMRVQPNYWKLLAKYQRKINYIISRTENLDVNEPSKLTKIGSLFMNGEAFPGSRNHALFVTTCDLMRAGKDEQEIREKLVPLALQIGLTLKEINATISSGIRKVTRGV